MEKIPGTVVHYGGKDPLLSVGGVESFARNLSLVFEKVQFMTPGDRDFDWVRRSRTPVVCDNHHVLGWPEDIPVIGFMHGVAAVKFSATRSPAHWLLGRRQARAAGRKNTLWVACARWIADHFEQAGQGTVHVIYHPVDVTRFDGRLNNSGSRLILCDARTAHKGKHLVSRIAGAFTDWTFEPLGCAPGEVPDRMRRARAFLHLSRYEGNSIVCNEAMAMNLPCFFTRVGLMGDRDGPGDVFLIDPDRAFRDKERLLAEAGSFLASLETREYRPRQWVLDHATPVQAVDKWRSVMAEFSRLSGW